MKIIWLVPECPLPCNTGGRKVEWNRIKSLARNNDIYLYLIVDDEKERKYQSEAVDIFLQELHEFINHYINIEPVID